MPTNKKPKSKSVQQRMSTRSATPRKTATQGKMSDKNLSKLIRKATGSKAVSVRRAKPAGARPKNKEQKLHDFIGRKTQIRTGKPVPKPTIANKEALKRQKADKKKSSGKGLGATGLRDKSSVISRRIKRI